MGLSGTSTPLLVSYPATAQAAPAQDLAAEVSTRHPVASSTLHYAAVSRATLARHDPRQAPGAGGPHAGLGAGGGWVTGIPTATAHHQQGQKGNHALTGS